MYHIIISVLAGMCKQIRHPSKVCLKTTEDLRGFWLGHHHCRSPLPAVVANRLAITAPGTVESGVGTNRRRLDRKVH